MNWKEENLKNFVNNLDNVMMEKCNNTGEEKLCAHYIEYDGRKLYEFGVWCSYPDRVVEIGAIDLDTFDCITYCGISCKIISEWPAESWIDDKTLCKLYDLYDTDDFEYVIQFYPPEDLLGCALGNIQDDIEQLIDLENYFYESINKDWWRNYGKKA